MENSETESETSPYPDLSSDPNDEFGFYSSCDEEYEEAIPRCSEPMLFEASHELPIMQNHSDLMERFQESDCEDSDDDNDEMDSSSEKFEDFEFENENIYEDIKERHSFKNHNTPSLVRANKYEYLTDDSSFTPERISFSEEYLSELENIEVEDDSFEAEKFNWITESFTDEFDEEDEIDEEVERQRQYLSRIYLPKQMNYENTINSFRNNQIQTEDKQHVGTEKFDPAFEDNFLDDDIESGGNLLPNMCSNFGVLKPPTN